MAMTVLQQVVIVIIMPLESQTIYMARMEQNLGT